MKILLTSVSLLALLGAGCSFSSNTANNTSPTPVWLTDTVTPVTPQRVVVDSTEKNLARVFPQPAGKEVNAAYVRLEKQGFVSIHADNKGKPGQLLGETQLLFAGDNTEVPVYAKTATSTTYWASLHIDNGDGKFKENQDSIAKDSNGNLVQFTFTTME